MNTKPMYQMDEKTIQQHSIAERYLQGKLTPEETAAFEEYILDKPELLEQLEVDMAFKVSLPMIKPRPAFQSSVSWWSLIIANVATACACLALVTIMSFDGTGHTERLNTSPDIIYMDTVRGQNGDFDINFAKNEMLKILVLRPSGIEKDHYVMQLIRLDSGKKVKSIGPINVNEQNEVVIMLDKENLSDGLYQLTLSAEKGGKTNAFNGTIHLGN